MEIKPEIIQSLFNSLGLTNSLIIALIIMLIINTGTTILKYFLDIRLKDREKHVHKRNLIVTKAIDFQVEVFQRIEKLSLFIKGEETELLKELQELQYFISNHRLYFNKEMFEIVNTVMDYYRKVLTSHSNKDLRQEKKNIDEYIKKFNN